MDKFLLKQIQSKAHIHFEEDYYSLTALSFLWTNIKKYKITDQKLAQTFYFLMMIFMVSNLMLLGILYSIFVQKTAELTEFDTGSFVLYIVRFVCSVALHIMLFPEVRKGMIIMKYVNNHPDKFRTSYIPFILGFLQYFSSIFAEFLNIYMLTYQSKIEFCIIHFVALEVVVELPKIFFESQHYDNYLYNVFKAELAVENKTKNIKFSERTFFHKCARVAYKIMRCFYASVIFYYIPFIVLFLQFVISNNLNNEHSGASQ